VSYYKSFRIVALGILLTALTQNVALASNSTSVDPMTILDLNSESLHLIVKASDPLFFNALVYQVSDQGVNKIAVLDESLARDGKSITLYLYGGARIFIPGDQHEPAIYSSQSSSSVSLQRTYLAEKAQGLLCAEALIL
jgi:hypothetical protein